MKFTEAHKKRFYVLAVACIAFGGIAIRVWHINAPLADWHSWRQSDTAAVARNFIKFGFDPLRPRFNDLSNIPSGRDNPMGWRMVEFPLYQLIGATLYTVYPNISLEAWLRVVTIAASTGIGVLLVILVGSVVAPVVGIIAMGVYTFLPYSIYYGRSILPDTFMVFWALLSVILAYAARNKAFRVWFTLSAAAAAVALLVKPVSGFLLLPVGYILFKRDGITKQFFIHALFFAIVSLIPLLLWRRWISQYPEGIPAFWWLLNSNHIRFKGSWFHWIFAERIGNLILGYWGLIPFGIGVILLPQKREGWISRWFLIGCLAYLTIIATGNVQHDYYQILIVPVLAVFVAKGCALFLDESVWVGQKRFVNRWGYGVFVIVCLLFTFTFSWFTIRTYYWINHPEIVDAGQAADRILPKEAKVIAPYNGDTTFLYQTNRQGWPIGFDIDKKIKMGATAYVTVSPTDADLETKELANTYTVLVRNSEYAIIDLTKPAK